MKTGLRNAIRRFLIPSYDEGTSLLLAFAVVTLFIVDASFRSSALRLGPVLHIPPLILPLIVLIPAFLIGLVLSVYHAFKSEPISQLHKRQMMIFALITDSIAAVAAGVHMVKYTSGVLLIFPAWNLINGVVLVYQIGLFDENRFEDRVTTRPQIILGIAVTALLLAVCYCALHLYWALTLSICIAYATGLDEVLQRVSRLDKRH